MLKKSKKRAFKPVSETEFTHPISTCICCIVLQFFITYLGFALIKVSNKKLQRNAENAYRNWMRKRAFSYAQTRQTPPVASLSSLL